MFNQNLKQIEINRRKKERIVNIRSSHKRPLRPGAQRHFAVELTNTHVPPAWQSSGQYLALPDGATRNTKYSLDYLLSYSTKTDFFRIKHRMCPFDKYIVNQHLL
jgi:hypothetical protein